MSITTLHLLPFNGFTWSFAAWDGGLDIGQRINGSNDYRWTVTSIQTFVLVFGGAIEAWPVYYISL
jgi:hypothetical protein